MYVTNLFAVPDIDIIATHLGSSLQEMLQCHKVVGGDQRCQFSECILDGTIPGFDLVMEMETLAFMQCMLACSIIHLKMGCSPGALNLRDFGIQLCSNVLWVKCKWQWCASSL